MDERTQFGMAYGVAVMHWLKKRFIYGWSEAVDRNELKSIIEAYTSSLETELTQDNCLCEWVEIGTTYGKKMVNSTRMGGSVNMECPVHTREGFLLAFIENHFDIETLTPDILFRTFRKAAHVE